MSRRTSLWVSLGLASSLVGAAMSGCSSSDEGDGSPRLLDGGAGEGASALPDDNGATGTASRLGAACDEDLDCGGGDLFCMTQESRDYLGGGPAGGLCTARCREREACRRIDPEAECVFSDPTQDAGLCLRSCTLGPPLLDERKCLGRSDLACVPLESGIGACVPMCGGHHQCGSGYCDPDPMFGVCVDALRDGLPLGSECDPTALRDPCQGICLGFEDDEAGTFGFCSSGCVIGAPGSCGADPTSRDPFDAICAYAASAPADSGDFGFCAQLCDCDGECRHPDTVCEPLPTRSLAQQVGRQGLCTPRLVAEENLPCEETPEAGVNGGPVEAGADGATLDAGGSPETDAGPAADAGADALAAADGGPDAEADAAGD